MSCRGRVTDPAHVDPLIPFVACKLFVASGSETETETETGSETEAVNLTVPGSRGQLYPNRCVNTPYTGCQGSYCFDSPSRDEPLICI